MEQSGVSDFFLMWLEKVGLAVKEKLGTCPWYPMTFFMSPQAHNVQHSGVSGQDPGTRCFQNQQLHPHSLELRRPSLCGILRHGSFFSPLSQVLGMPRKEERGIAQEGLIHRTETSNKSHGRNRMVFPVQ